MTSIKIHGKLGVNMKDLKMNITKVSDVIDAIDANRPGFIKKINSLSRQGFNYSIIVDNKRVENSRKFNSLRKPKKIDIVPIMSGRAGIGAAFGAITAWAANNVLLANLAIFIIGTAVQMLLQPSPSKNNVKATEATTRGLERSFEFSNKANIAAQGIPVPVGYGRLKVGTQVIQACVKTFPQNVQAADAMIANPFYTVENIALSNNNKV